MSHILLLTLSTFDDTQGGVEMWADHLKTALVKGKHRVTHWSLSTAIDRFRNADGKNAVPPIIDSLQRETGTVVLKPELVWWMNQQFNRIDLTPFDLVIGNSDELYGFDRRGKRTVSVFHGCYKGCGSHTEDLLYASVYNDIQVLSSMGARYVFVSENSRAEFASNFGASDDVINEWTVIPNGVDTRKFRPMKDKKQLRKKFNLRDDKVVALYIGHRTKSKGFDIWVDLTKREYSTDINFWAPGNVPHDMLPEMFNAVDYLVFPSEYEGCPYTVLEAMSCGTPVIMTPTGFASGMKDGQTEFGFIKSDWKRFNPIWYKTTGMDPRQWVMDNGFTLNRFATDWDKFVKGVVDNE